MRARAWWFGLMVTLVALPGTAQQSVAGKWYASVETTNGPLPVEFEFVVDAASRLTGTVSSDFFGATPISDGVLNGDALSFKAVFRTPQSSMTFSYTGVVKGNELALTLTRTFDGGPPDGGPTKSTFKATRAKPAELSLSQETTMVPVFVDGQSVRLEMRIYKPDRAGRVPTLVVHHGSTGEGRDPSLFTQPITFPALARFFVQRGWAVVAPARRGRAGSEGLYDEGFAPDRTLGYSCDPAQSLPGADRALRDIAASLDAILAMPFVDRDHIVIGGQSRGGILAVAYAGLHPAQVKGVINFVGGWVGSPRCATARAINQELFRRGAHYPGDTLWLYGDGDTFYPLSHSRENFAAFQAAGGKGTFQAFPQPESRGHNLFTNPDAWAPLVEAYLKHQGLPIGATAP
jgi:dienelactone hydrolase